MRRAPPTLLIRADADARTGTGHVMRCLALAQAWRAHGGHVVLATAALPSALSERLRRERIRVVRAQGHAPASVVRLARRVRASWVALDGYGFDLPHQKALLKDDRRVLFIDDYAHARAYWADLVLNHGAGADDGMYGRRAPWTRVLVGPAYALLRREFSDARPAPFRRQARRVLVTLGGADPPNATLRVLRGLEAVPQRLEVTVVVGPANPHVASLRDHIGRSRHAIRLAVAPGNMPSLMRSHDVAVAAGGGTAWELAHVGLPFAVLVVAENQRGVARGLADLGLALPLGHHASVKPATVSRVVGRLLRDPTLRRTLRARGRRLVDGRGAQRTAERMLRGALTLRPARLTDARLLWRWANEAETRRQSFTTQAIAWPDHLAWLRGKLAAPDVDLFILLDKAGRPVGQVRFDRRGTEATISVGIDATRRGEGFGVEAIRFASRQAVLSRGLRRIHAYIRPSNGPSLAAFRRAGFVRDRPTRVRGQAAEHFVLRAPRPVR